MEEYVPTTTPIEKAREKLYVIGPPKKTSARYKNMWDTIFFLMNIIARIIEVILKIKTGSIDMLRRCDRAMPEQNDIVQYRIGRFIPHLLR